MTSQKWPNTAKQARAFPVPHSQSCPCLCATAGTESAAVGKSQRLRHWACNSQGAGTWERRVFNPGDPCVRPGRLTLPIDESGDRWGWREIQQGGQPSPLASDEGSYWGTGLPGGRPEGLIWPPNQWEGCRENEQGTEALMVA